MTKKSYNPFKMWGSYVGTFIGFVIGTAINFSIIELLPTENLFKVMTDLIIQNFLNISLYLIVGFLIGWAIHSLIRRLRK